jgi:hypothetical protein
VIYLTGCDVHDGPDAGLGLLVTPLSYGASGLDRVLRYRWWAADNACFAQGDSFDEAAWWRWLWRMRWASPFWCRGAGSFCLFATAPDVVGDPVATYRRGWTRLHHLRNHGLPAAFVAQDGLERFPDVRAVGFWDEFDCLFIGGTDPWKLGPGAAWLAGEARVRRKWVHMGRVNSLTRLLHADRIGCHSVDGTYLAFGPRVNLARLTRWMPRLERARAQLELPL